MGAGPNWGMDWLLMSPGWAIMNRVLGFQNQWPCGFHPFLFPSTWLTCMTVRAHSGETQGDPPLKMQRWTGPIPSRLQRLLLNACLAPMDGARAAWDQWLACCRFDLEDAASIELAALAVARLGEAAGHSSQAQRCRGWNRRAWFVSELARDAAQRVARRSHELGLETVAVGDLVTALAGVTFAGRVFPVRSLILRVSPGSVENHIDLDSLRLVALEGPAGDAIRTRKLPMAIEVTTTGPSKPAGPPPGAVWLPSPWEGMKGLEPAEQIAWLAARNWCRQPSGRLRWMLEVIAIAESQKADEELGPRVACAAERDGNAASVLAAFRWIGKLPGTAAIAPVLAAMELTPVSFRSQLRRCRMTSRLGPAWVRLNRWRLRWQRTNPST